LSKLINHFVFLLGKTLLKKTLAKNCILNQFFQTKIHAFDFRFFFNEKDNTKYETKKRERERKKKPNRLKLNLIFEKEEIKFLLFYSQRQKVVFCLCESGPSYFCFCFKVNPTEIISNSNMYNSKNNIYANLLF